MLSIFVSSFFLHGKCSALLQLKCRSRQEQCRHTGKWAWILQAFSLILSCFSRVSEYRQGNSSSRALSQTQTEISKVGLDPWDYSLTGGWECGGNVYKGCRKGIESQWSWEAAIVPDHRIWVWQADYSVLQRSEPNCDHHMNFDVFNVVHGWAVVSRTDPFMLSQVFFSWQFYGHK